MRQSADVKTGKQKEGRRPLKSRRLDEMKGIKLFMRETPIGDKVGRLLGGWCPSVSS
jgi:hypothetical protein